MTVFFTEFTISISAFATRRRNFSILPVPFAFSFIAHVYPNFHLTFSFSSIPLPEGQLQSRTSLVFISSEYAGRSFESNASLPMLTLERKSADHTTYYL